MNELATAALDYATRIGWEVFPCRGKIPLIEGGVLSATNDPAVVRSWWQRWPNGNIGGRVPCGLIVVDIDPRHDGAETLLALTDEHGPIVTRTVLTGRGDGGRHLFLRHPGGRIKAKIGPGIDVKTHAGYTILPPSIHPDTGGEYRWTDPKTPFAMAPGWLVDLLRPPPPPPPKRAVPTALTSDSPADWYTAAHSWGEVLAPHGWTVAAGDGEIDGSAWRHPTATGRWSASISFGMLFVYSTNTPFVPTEPGYPYGYTRFHAYAVLDHGGDQVAAARAVRASRSVTS